MSQSLQDTIKILVVDDEPDMEPMIRQKFRRQIRDNSLNFEFAYNGVEAIDKITEFPEIGIVLSDINMPEMDGLTLLAKIRDLKKPGLKTVIVSAYGDMENIRTAMNRGAYDFITKPVNFNDLEKTINKTLDEITAIRRWLAEHDKLVSIENDLSISREIQQAILPSNFTHFPDEFNVCIYGSMVAAKEVGGDFYDFFQIDDQRLGFVIGDVSGKGISAAIFMAVSRTLIRATGLKGDSVSDCMEHVNNLLCRESVSCMFVTAFYGILDTKSGQVDYVNAGHNAPYLLSADNIRELELTDGLALGVDADFSYQSKQITLKPGEQLLLYTDGVTEAENLEEAAYGTQKFENLLRENLDLSIKELLEKSLEDVKQFAGNAPQSDDITFLGLTFTGE
jgi:phosphoserine phosphatase RsbU/P